MKISFKILGGYFVISLLLIAMGVLVIRTSSVLNPVIEELNIEVNNLDGTITFSDLTANIVFLRSQLRYMATQFYFTTDPNYVEKYAHTESQLESVFNHIIDELTNEDDQKIFQNLKSSIDKLAYFEKSFIASVKEDQSAAFELFSQNREYQRLNKSVSDFINSYSYRKKVESADVFSRLIAIADSIQVSKKEITRRSQTTLFLIVVVCIVSILVGVIVSRSISIPIIKLRDKVAQIGKGEFVNIEETALRDEVGDLVNTFSKMTLDLKTNIETRRQAENDFKESEERIRLLLDLTAEAIYGLDLNGNCTFCNAACLRILDYENQDDLLGKNMHELTHHTRVDGSPYPVEDCQIYKAFIKNERSHVDTEVLFRKDESSFPAEYWSYPIDRDGEIVGSVVTFLDITKRQVAQEKLKRNHELSNALVKIQSEIISSPDPHSFFDNLLSILLSVTNSKYGFIGEIPHDENGDPYLKIHAITNISWNDEIQKFFEENAPAGLEFHNLDNLFGTVIKTGETVIANDAKNDPRSGGLPPGHPALNAFLGVPLHFGQDFIGMIGMANRPGGYDEILVQELQPLLTTCANVIVDYRNDERRREIEAQLRDSEARLRDLLLRIESTREEERAIIARDIHDELGQTLTGLKMDLSWVRDRMPRNWKKLPERMQAMISLVDSTVDYVGKLSARLRPAILDDLGLEAAIEWEAQVFAERTNCNYTLDLKNKKMSQDRDRNTAVFRIFQEALTNVTRHAKATEVGITLRTSNSQLILEVKDDGVGIAEDKINSTDSIGLFGMQERAGAFGGHVYIDKVKEGGTQVRLVMPLSETA